MWARRWFPPPRGQLRAAQVLARFLRGALSVFSGSGAMDGRIGGLERAVTQAVGMAIGADGGTLRWLEPPRQARRPQIVPKTTPRGGNRFAVALADVVVARPGKGLCRS